MAGDRSEHIQLPELMSPTKSVFVRDCLEKAKVKRTKHGKRHSEQRSEKLNTLAARSIDKPPSEHVANRDHIRTRIMHYQWSKEFPGNESQVARKRKGGGERGDGQALRYPDLSLFLSMLHNNKISDATKVKRIYGK